MQINESSICYNNTAVIIGKDSKFEISYEKRDYEGVNKIEKIEDIASVKITFFQLTLSLLNWLKASEKESAGIKFWNRTGEANGIYQSHFTCDEFKQTVTLHLYQKRTEPKTSNYTADLLELGIILLFPFGKGNAKIGNVTIPLNRTAVEKNISTEVQKYKFADGWQYFITDKTSFYLKINDLTTEGSALISQLDGIKTGMLDFIPHSDNPAVKYSNAYMDFEKKEANGRFTAEINLQLVSEITNLNFVYPPIINRIGKLSISAMSTSQICYTYSANGTPADPEPENWIAYSPEMNLAYGNYKIVAVENGIMSAVIYEEIKEQEEIVITEQLKPLKPVFMLSGDSILIEAEPGTEIFYTENQYGLSAIPTQKNWVAYNPEGLPLKNSNYRAIARKDYKNSEVAELTKTEIDDYLRAKTKQEAIETAALDATEKASTAKTAAEATAANLASTAKSEAVNAAVYTAASLANAAKLEAITAAETKFSEMVGSSPETLNTLSELATALGNDPNFATTTATELGKRIKTTDALAAIGTAKSEAISAAKSELDNLQIGGRNAILNSKLPFFWACNTNLGDPKIVTQNGVTFIRSTGIKTDANGTNPNGRIQVFHPTVLDLFQPGDKITISIDVKQDSGTNKHVGLYAENQNAWGGIDDLQSGKWTRITATGTKTTAGLFAIILQTTDCLVLDYKNLKLELGSKSTDWTPAPEDVTAEISTAKSEAITAANETTAAVAARVDEVEQTTSENSESISTTWNKLTGLEKSSVFAQNKIVFGNQDWTDLIVGGTKSQFTYSDVYQGLVVMGDQTFVINSIMAIDPLSSYKVTVKCSSLDGNATLNCGVDTLNANKLSIAADQANPYNWGAAFGSATSLDIQKYEGYFSGYNAPGESNRNKFDPNGRYFRVAISCNKLKPAEFRSVIHSVEIEKISTARAIDIIEDDSRRFVSLAEKNKITETYDRVVALEELTVMQQSMLECISQKLIEAHINVGICAEAKI